MNKDLEHLKILSMCYYISAGITALFSCFPLIHLTMGILLVSGAFPNNSKGAAPPPAFIGWFFILFATVFILGGWMIAVATFFAGKFLKQKRNYIFCLVVAGVNCLFFPIGMVLGVFTFIVLLRESVRAIFNGAAALPLTSVGNMPVDWR